MPTVLEHPAVQRVLDVAARKGVTLEVMTFPDSTHTASDAARVVGAELGQIVKSLVFVTAAEDGSLEPIVCLVSGADRVDLGPEISDAPDELCRAELRVDGPAGGWTVRFASTLNDEPSAQLWDTAGQLVVKYGFHGYGLEARTGTPSWRHRSATPLLAIFASSRLRHVILQAELETFAIEPDGTVAWRIAHSDVVTEASMVGGRLVLTGYGGGVNAIDPATGRSAG